MAILGFSGGNLSGLAKTGSWLEASGSQARKIASAEEASTTETDENIQYYFSVPAITE